jgi:hypothetical protein
LHQVPQLTKGPSWDFNLHLSLKLKPYTCGTHDICVLSPGGVHSDHTAGVRKWVGLECTPQLKTLSGARIAAVPYEGVVSVPLPQIPLTGRSPAEARLPCSASNNISVVF